MSDIDLKLSNYDFDLPGELIAERPVEGRHNSKLLVYKAISDEIIHDHFYNISNYLPENSLLVLNQSKVFPCRLIGKKKTGGKCEVFLLSSQADSNGLFSALIKTSSRKNIGDEYFFEDGLVATIKEISDGNFFVSFNQKEILSYLERYAKIPIPPYIRNGESDDLDKRDYQTLFAKDLGSVAAPTAGLHFTEDVFKKLSAKGVERAEVTLHVGLGTFASVKTDSLSDHKMHSEKFFVNRENKNKIISHDKIFAVGTTSLRVLESCHNGVEFDINSEDERETSIFLHPGVEVNSVSGLITNFHLPKSTLLMLVSSLIGREKCLALYNEAIEHKYRFFSYGDSMLILRNE